MLVAQWANILRREQVLQARLMDTVRAVLEL